MDISKNEYTVKATLKSGAVLDVTPAVTRLSWQDPAEEIAQRASITVAQTQTAQGWLNTLLPLCTLITIMGNGAEVFRGIVWEWEYSSGNSHNQTELTCYDHFIYAQKSKSFAYYPAGKSTKDILSDICSKNGIQLNYQYESITHGKTVHPSKVIADQILSTLEEAKKELKTNPVALYEKQVLVIRPKGKNTTVYNFGAKENTISTSERMTLDQLMTVVKVMGKEDKEGRRSVEATVNGKTEYGTLQEVVYRDSKATLDSVQKEAQKLIEENGEPKRIINAEAPDVPCIRKGDAMKINAGSLSNSYYVNGVTHDATAGTMKMELEPAQDAASQTTPGGANNGQKTGACTGDGVRIRSAPNTDGTILGLLYKGQKVTVLESRNGWCKIQRGSTTGWSSAQYLTIS